MNSLAGADFVINTALAQRIAADVSQSVSKQFPDFFTDELMIPLIEAIACDIPIVLIVNMLNRNHLVPGIPEDFEVEVPALCSGRGIQDIQTARCPNTSSLTPCATACPL